MALREVLVMLGMEISKDDENNVKGAVDRVKQLAGVLAGVWAGVKLGSGLFELAEGVGEAGDEILRTSTKLGVTTQALQEQRFAAEQVSISAEELGGAYRVLGKQAEAASSGNKEAASSFARLGVNVKDGSGKLKTVDQLLKDVADGLKGVENPTEKAAIAAKVLGRSGASLIPMLANGSAGLEEMAKMAAETGNILGGETLDSAAKFDDASDLLNATIRGLKNTLGAELLPIVTDLIIGFQKAVKATLPFVKAIGKGLGVAFSVLNSTVEFTKTVFDNLTDTYGKFGYVLGGLGVALTAIATSFAIVGKSATIAGLKAAAAWVLAALPIIAMALLIAAIGAAIFLVIDDFQTFQEGGESVIGNLLAEFGSFGGAIRGIFLTAFKAIFGITEETFDGMLATALAFFDGLISPVRFVVDFIMNAFMTLYDFFAKLFIGDFQGAFTALWDGIVITVQKAWDDIKGVFSAVNEIFSFLSGKNDIEAEITRRQELVGIGNNVLTKGNFSGAAASEVTPSPVPVAGGARSSVVAPQTSIAVHVDARGNPNGAEVGKETGDSVSAVTERMHRDTVNAFTDRGSP